MSQSIEECVQLFCIHCADIGLDCNCTIYGIGEEKIIENMILHMFENHAISPDEMTTCMRMKILENVCITTLPYLQVLAYIIMIFDKYHRAKTKPC
jgi:predicted small metal-binding protein